MKPRVALIYDQDCPNVGEARAALRLAFDQVHRSPIWTEWDSRAPEAPALARMFGSPTILVDGKDVTGLAPGSQPDCCRVYGGGDGSAFRGVPPVSSIAKALTAMGERDDTSGRGWTRSLALVPGLGAALLPVGVCPACWPAYAALLSSLGLGFLLDAAYLLPATAVVFLIALASLAYRARERWGFRPLGLGCLATALALLGKFAIASDLLLYLGLALLIGASLWHAWPRRAAAGSCPNCAPQESVSLQHAHQKES